MDGATFPHTIEDSLTRASISLYAEKDRASVTYRIQRPNGTRTKKTPVPKELGREVRRIPADGVVHDDLITWATAVLMGSRPKLEGRPNPERINHVQLGYVFKRVRESEWYRELSDKRRDEVDLPMRWAESVLGADCWLDTWDDDTIKTLRRKRQEEGILTTAKDGTPMFRPAAGRNTTVRDLNTLKTVFKRATKIKYTAGQREWLLDTNPFDRLDSPKPGTRQAKTSIGQWRYEILMDYADQVDPTGRFRFALVIARWVAPRTITIRRLTRSVVLETEQEIRAALDNQLCNYVEEHDRDDVAKLYADNGGAIYIRYWMVKAGQSGDENRVEQYDAVYPVAPIVMEEWRHYWDRHWAKLGLGPDDPLLPGEDLTKSISGETMHDWFRDAEFLAEKDGRSLKLPPKNQWHGFRLNRRTEYRTVHDKYGRFLVGHSIHTGTPGITVSEGRYMGLVPKDLVQAVRVSV
jgi:hypothetical protein